MTTHVIGDTGVLTGRSLRHIVRSPDTIITTAVTPVALMLLFTYVFGGAIDVGNGQSYVDYLLPGILLITIASGVAYTSYRLFLDLQGGIVERPSPGSRWWPACPPRPWTARAASATR